MAKQLFEQSFIDELNDRTNIVDLIGRYVSLKKDSGHKYKCCCPFHDEKTPSFYVDEQKNSFKCFGGSCGESGDPIGFLQKHNGLNFVEAVRELAAINGIQVPSNDDDKEFAKFRRQYMEFNSRLHHHLQDEASTPKGITRLNKLPMTREFRDKLEMGTIIDKNRMGAILQGASLSQMRDTLKKIEVVNQDGSPNLPTAGLYLPIKTKRGATLGFTFVDSKLQHYVLPESDMLKPEDEFINLVGIDRKEPVFVAFSLLDAIHANQKTGSANILINPVGEAVLSKAQIDKVNRASDSGATYIIPRNGNNTYFAMASLLTEYDPLRPVQVLDTRTNQAAYLLDHINAQWDSMPEQVQGFLKDVAAECGKDYLLNTVMSDAEKSRDMSPAVGNG